MDLIQFYDKFNNINKEIQLKINRYIKRNNGIYYTNLRLTNLMVYDLFQYIKHHHANVHNYILHAKFMEPCVGIGNFVFSYLKYLLLNYKFSKKEWEQIISNIYVFDNDSRALSIYLKFLRYFMTQIIGVPFNDSYKFTNIGGGLIYDEKVMNKHIINPSQYIGKDIKFDIIMTNPPYINLRAQKRNFINFNIFNKYKKYYKDIKKRLKAHFWYQGLGTPNIYKFFVESILNKYLKSNGISYLLIPQQILKDKSTTPLRELLLNHGVHLIRNFSERSDCVKANQALSAILLFNDKRNKGIKIFNGLSNRFKFIRINDIKKNPNLEILNLSPYDEKILHTAKTIPKVSDLQCIINMRGELDMSLDKQFIINRKTKYRFIKGRNVSLYKLKGALNKYYVTSNFVKKSNKQKYICKNRLICPQISNMRSKKRLKFVIVPKNYVLGNSLNFLYVINNKYNINLYYLLGLFNSDVYERLFRMFSSNNHINNYNINLFPIPINDSKFMNIITKLSKEVCHGKNVAIKKINRLISLKFTGFINSKKFNYDNKVYKQIKAIFPYIKSYDIKRILNNSISIKLLRREYKLSKNNCNFLKELLLKNKCLLNKKVLNHKSFSLSKLDMAMISHVKPGGNWEQIPIKIAKKSKRLMTIRRTGGRTTLYGRLQYNKPSYTITTYFNRPGNGANIHPKYNRVLSVREAARIQAFPDNYYFIGTQRDKLNQIGNAVPPFISYQIGNKLIKYLNVHTSLDLFSGAGGLTLGFILSGFKSILANDIDSAALSTMKINIPNLDVLVGDINNPCIINRIIKISKLNKVDMIDGGPPCQGFSLAGFRKLNDPRSKLIFKYTEVLSKIMPKVFVFENVTGLLSINRRKTFRSLSKLFLNIGYKIYAKKMDFSNYGIPQKRKRVIVIGIRNDINANPKYMFPTPTTLRHKITVFDAIGDLNNVPLDKNEFYTIKPVSEYCRMLRNFITPKQYLKYLFKYEN